MILPNNISSSTRVRLLSERPQKRCLEHLRDSGLRVEMLIPEDIEGIEPDSLNVTYVVPAEWSKDLRWPSIRVQLARSCRHYIVIGDHLSTQEIVAATRDGAHDVIDLRDTQQRVIDAIENAARSQQLWWQLYGGQSIADGEFLVGRSSAVSHLREMVQRVGPTNTTVLITGESGTGKERVAQALQASHGSGPFVILNCAAIPPDLLESELFGVEKGAYTGAVTHRKGLVEEASGGTLFLDEIGELSLALQPKLLRFLETHVARRVGSNREYQADVRVISATNRDLRVEADAGRFRADLYYRLAEVIINTIPLRQRLEDIPELGKTFISIAAERLGKNFESLEPELVFQFQQYDWPGNVRELKQTIERLAIHYDGPIMRAGWWQPPEPIQSPAANYQTPTAPQSPPVPAPQNHIPPETLTSPAGMSPEPSRQSTTPITFGSPSPQPNRPLNKKERFALARRLIEESGEDLTWVCAQMGIHPTTLYRWRKEGKV
ncbi:MAG: sigma 54-interacting transcriptional regulator [Verrucomicrobiota bacterium]